MTQTDLADISRTFHFNSKEYTFSALHGTSSKVDHNLGHKAILNRHKKIEIIPCIFSDFHDLKLDFNNSNSNNSRPTNSWKLDNSLLNYCLVNEEIKKLETSSFRG